MPTELAFLPMVESAFNPMAYSRAHASGLWQFIPSTGKNYNLKQDWWMDQRRDVVAATSAALDYLQTIYDMHGDWFLALASYNWGEGAVARAIKKNEARSCRRSRTSFPARNSSPRSAFLQYRTRPTSPPSRRAATSTSRSPRNLPRCRCRNSSR